PLAHHVGMPRHAASAGGVRCAARPTSARRSPRPSHQNGTEMTAQTGTPATAESIPLDIGSDDCLVEQRGHTLIVTMNRPQVRNALSAEMMATMQAAWDRVDGDRDIRVAVLTGAGGAFCAGMDLKAMNSAPPGESMRTGGEGGGARSGGLDVTSLPALLKGRRLTKPLIAAVEGPAISGGTEILQGTDIRVAGRSARFGVSEARWGLYPLGGSAVRLPRQIPYTVAMEILLTGRHLTAEEAERHGLIGSVVDDGAALETAVEIAESIAANGPLAVQGMIETIRRTEGMHEEEAFAVDAEVGGRVFGSADAKE